MSLTLENLKAAARVSARPPAKFIPQTLWIQKCKLYAKENETPDAMTQ